MFGKQKQSDVQQPGPAQLAMIQTIAKMIGVPPDVLAKAFYTIASAGERLERLEAKIDVLIAQRPDRNGDRILGARPQPNGDARIGGDRSGELTVGPAGEHG